ncbi:lyase family protein [Fluviispira multicolorata]|nr:lyase family protein [Fluviispira multicolorata]
MDIKKFAFIESNTTGTGEIFVQKALEKGYQILFLAADPSRYSFLNKYLISPIKIDTSNEECIIKCLENEKNILGIFSSSEYFIEVTASVAEKFSLPCNSVTAIHNCRNKEILAEILAKFDIPIPYTILIKNENDFIQIQQKIQFPVVVKPASGSGSIGVKLCKNLNDFVQHVKQLLSHTKNERGNSVEPKILVQEYIMGSEYSVEVLKTEKNFEILGITQKYLGEEPYFLEIGHDFPAKLSSDIELKIKNTVLKSLNAMNFIFGAAHIELRIHNNQAYIIEINPRLAGGMIPALIEKSLGIDLIDLLLDLYCGKEVDVKFNLKRFSSIRFLIPEKAGVIAKIDGFSDMEILDKYYIAKNVGDICTQLGDFRDRIGYLISSADSLEESRFKVNKILEKIRIVIDDHNEQRSSYNKTGRLSKTIHSDAQKIVLKKKSANEIIKELNFLTHIDEAHILMLLEQKIISDEKAELILKQIKLFKQNSFSDFFERDALRGTYLLYENIMIEKLGMETGGMIHTGRSRNDINATVFKLNAREHFQNIYNACWKLRNSILQQAQNNDSLIMPIYSQFQPALSGTYAFYLIAIEEALSREQNKLKVCFDNLMECPLGAGAGCGTSFPIDTKLTAKYLGFKNPFVNALDAVASRDLALNLLSILSMMGTVISRIAHDFQLWTTQEFSFFDLPDELCGGSSMMPQKKNPFLLEKIKGKSIIPCGILMSSLATIHKTPFSNSVEVGTEALVDFERSFKEIIESMQLLELILKNAKPNAENMFKSNTKGLTIALGVTEKLVKLGLPFRESHFKVGEAIQKAIDSKQNPLEAILSLLPDNCLIDNFDFGGGASKLSVNLQNLNADKRLREDGLWLQEKIKFWNQSLNDKNLKIEMILKERIE